MMHAFAAGVCAFFALVTSGAAQDAPRSPQSIECSKQADAQGLHGQERLDFRRQCLVAAPSGAPATTPAPAVSSNDMRPTFNCARARSAAARLICSDTELAKADAGIGAAYRSALADGKTPDDKSSLTKAQLEWIRGRNSRCGLDGKDATPVEELQTAKPCLLKEYKQQTLMLTTWWTGASGGSANGMDSQSAAEGNEPLSPKEATDVVNVLRRIWNPAGYMGTIDVNIYLKPDGLLSAPPEIASKPSDDVNYKAAAENLKQAISRAQPFSMLRKQSYANWKTLRLSFGPPGGATPDIARSAMPVFEPVFGTSVTVCPGCSGAPQKNTTFYEVQYKTDVMVASAHCTLTNAGGRLGVGLGIKFSSFTRQLLDDQFVTSFLNNMRKGAYEACRKGMSAGILVNYLFQPVHELSEFATARVFHNDGLGIEATSENFKSPWVFTYEGFKLFEKQRLAQIAAQEAAQAQARRIAETRARVVADLKIESFVDMGQLSANPFIYKGKIVGIYATFDRMVSENEGIFTSGVGSFVASGIPSTRFSGRDYVLFSGQVIGLKAAGVPNVQYVGSYSCAQNACQGF